MTTSPEPKKRSFIFSALPFFIIAHAAHHFLMALTQPLLPSIRSYFKVDTYGEASYVPMSFALASATGQLPGGWLADRIGPTVLIMIGTLGVAVAGVLVGISTTYVMLIVFLMLRFGLIAGMSGVFVANFLGSSPLTTDLSAWYSGGTFFTIGIIFLIAGYGFFASVERSRLISDELD